MLTTEQAATLIAASSGAYIFDTQNVPGDLQNAQSCLLGGYLLDMLAGQQIMWPGYYQAEDTGHINDALCIVIVVNALSVPLVKNAADIYSGEIYAQAAAQWLDTMGNLTTQGEAVPAADADGNVGMAVWAVSTANYQGSIDFGMSFNQNSAFPGMSIGATIWSYTERAICLLSGPNQQTAARNTAWNSASNNSPWVCSLPGPPVVRASFQFPDPTNTGILFITVSPS